MLDELEALGFITINDEGMSEITISNEEYLLKSRELREHIIENSPDINLNNMFNCSLCGHEWESEIPIDISFF